MPLEMIDKMAYRDEVASPRRFPTLVGKRVDIRAEGDREALMGSGGVR